MMTQTAPLLSSNTHQSPQGVSPLSLPSQLLELVLKGGNLRGERRKERGSVDPQNKEIREFWKCEG